MNNKKQNINKYWKKYKKLYSFEKFSAIYREKELLKSISFLSKDVLEIGCGFRPIFKLAKKYKSYLAIEPGNDPFKFVLKSSKKNKKVTVINSTFEEWCSLKPAEKFDVIILPGVLHEISSPKKFLKLCLNHLRDKGIIYINVPNTNSLHRRLAVHMGLIEKNSELSNRNKKFQQNFNYSFKDMSKLINKISSKLKIVKLESFFLKPFTHSQMMTCVSRKIIDHNVIKALYHISDQIGELGSEIVCIVHYKK